ncbi:MAG: cytochrome c1 [Alphaproteobacteria bacterium]
MPGRFLKRLRDGALAACLGLMVPAVAVAAPAGPTPPAVDWKFNGIFGTFDQAEVQRGFLVYDQVCAVCHAMSLASYRYLMQAGVSEAAAAEIASQKTVRDGPDDDGEMFDRPGRLSDRFVSPYPNENAARAANAGAYPPDLSLLAKSRAGGPDYLYGLLIGYIDPPPGFEVPSGMYYNEYFPGHLIAMAPPLMAGGVEYPDGTDASVEQMARDVSAFMMFIAEPSLEQRKRMGVKVMLFLIIFTALLYAVKRKVWARIH